jgi:CheY-like chemotaxis protein
MTEGRLPLNELLQKAGDGDFLRAVAESVLQLLMEADVEGLIGAGRLNWRNGYRDRTLDTRLGSLNLKIPKLRAGSYFPPLSRPSAAQIPIRGLGLGADDYLSKPFHNDELIARIHALVRRSKGPVGLELLSPVARRFSLGERDLARRSDHRGRSRTSLPPFPAPRGTLQWQGNEARLH